MILKYYKHPSLGVLFVFISSLEMLRQAQHDIANTNLYE